MQINSVSSTSPASFVKPASVPQEPKPAGDQVSMSISADTFSSMVNDASQMPEVRGELVDAFKSRIQSGTYPSSDDMDRLIDVMGGTWAGSGSSEGTSSSSDVS